MSIEKQKPEGACENSHGEGGFGPPASGRRVYHPPVLSRFGDVRGLTLGGSPGPGDSPNVNEERPPS